MDIKLNEDFVKVVDWLAKQKKMTRDSVLELVMREYLNIESNKDSVVENMFWGLDRGILGSEWKDIANRIPNSFLVESKSKNQLPKNYFFYCVIPWHGATTIVITTKTEWKKRKCCNDGWTQEESTRIAEIGQTLKMYESMENHYSTGKTVDEVKQIMSQFDDFKYHKNFEKFIIDCET